MDTLDIVLLNIISYCGGVFTAFLFVFGCEERRFAQIARRNYQDGAMNHQQIVYPNNSPVIAQPSAPTITEITLK